jgi:hypothetical protein
VTPSKYTAQDAAEIRRVIECGDLPRAVRLYQQLFPTFTSAVIRDLDEGDLEDCMLRPIPILSFCSDAELREVRIRMALAMCLQIRAERAIIPDETLRWPYAMSPRAVAQNFFNSIATHRNVGQWKKSGFVRTVKISNSSDGPCQVCKAAAGQEYDIRDLPQLPLHNCENLNDVGCRCVLVAAKLIEPSKRW